MEKNSQTQNFMKIHRVEFDLLRAEKQTDETNSRFRNFAKVPRSFNN